MSRWRHVHAVGPFAGWEATRWSSHNTDRRTLSAFFHVGEAGAQRPLPVRPVSVTSRGAVGLTAAGWSCDSPTPSELEPGAADIPVTRDPVTAAWSPSSTRGCVPSSWALPERPALRAPHLVSPSSPRLFFLEAIFRSQPLKEGKLAQAPGLGDLVMPDSVALPGGWHRRWRREAQSEWVRAGTLGGGRASKVILSTWPGRGDKTCWMQLARGRAGPGTQVS